MSLYLTKPIPLSLYLFVVSITTGAMDMPRLP